MRTQRPAALPDCVPPAWLDAIDAVGRGTLGRADLPRAALIPEVEQLSAAYTRERSVGHTLTEAPRTAGALAARLRFFLPRDLAKIGGPLEELRLAGALPDALVRGTRRVRVLDVGAGLGATCLGAATYLKTHGLVHGGLEVDAIDSDPRALGVLTALARETRGAGKLAQVAVSTDVRTHALDVTAVDALPRGPYDLVLVGFALNELFATPTLPTDAIPPVGRGLVPRRAPGRGQAPTLPETETLTVPRDAAIARCAAWLVSLAERLSEDGALVVLEPALRDTSRALQAVRDVLAARSASPYVVAPCLRSGPCPMLLGDRDWCHASLPLALPGPVAEIARGAGLRFEGLRYSYLVLRREADAMRARLRDTAGVTFRIVGDTMRSKGKIEVFACGEPGLVRLMRLDREASDKNGALGEAARGDVLCVEPLELRPVPPEEKAGIPRARLGAETGVTRV